MKQSSKESSNLVDFEMESKKIFLNRCSSISRLALEKEKLESLRTRKASLETSKDLLGKVIDSKETLKTQFPVL